MQPIQVIDAADDKALAAFDAVIDVRSPGEFALDHAPGAINLPVLSDAERECVGAIYVQRSRFEANRIGAAYVARNIARHLEGALAHQPPSFAPLIYCWRGGNRSQAMATILSRVGWRTSVLTGGYRTYRHHVQTELYQTACPVRFVLLDGNTGTAKTEILARLDARGVQVLDLEGLASHRGSLFGGIAGRPQPSQKMFESQLLSTLRSFDPSRLVVVEAESSKIGDRMTPPSVWQAMQGAPRLEIVAPRPVRAAYLVVAYDDIIADPQALETAFQKLPIPPAPARLETWRRLVAAGDFATLAEALIELHYDPAYTRARRKDGVAPFATIEVDALDDVAQTKAADKIVGYMAKLELGG